MILNTGSRTDIPAFYSQWLLRRFQEGYCLVRNPYHGELVFRYRLDPSLIDLVTFCTKNPAPLLPHLEAFESYRCFWHVTITPYGKEIEPFVPPVDAMIKSFQTLSRKVGPQAVAWRYDPILLTDTYTTAFHLAAFASMASALEGYTNRVIFSFLDLYEKTKKNFPEGKEVPLADRMTLAKGIAEIGKAHGMKVHSCLEGDSYTSLGIDTSGCFTRQVLEEVIGEELQVPPHSYAREGCKCLLGADIGAYNTCRHFCKYCYANYDRETVLKNSRLHDPESPFLVGHSLPGDQVREAKQEKWSTGQLNWFHL